MKITKIITLFLLLSAISGYGQATNDESYSAKQYQKLGMPDLNKKWAPEDYEKSISVLNEIKKDNFKALPRLASQKSDACFKKTVGYELLTEFKDTTLDDDSRLSFMSTLNFTFKKLLFIYYNTAETRYSYSHELIELFSFQLQIGQEMFKFVDDEMGGIEMTQSQKDGLRQMKDGYVQMVQGLIIEMSNTTAYDATDLEKLSVALKNSVILNIKWIGLDPRIKLKEQLTKVEKNAQSDVVKNNCRTMINAL